MKKLLYLGLGLYLGHKITDKLYQMVIIGEVIR